MHQTIVLFLTKIYRRKDFALRILLTLLALVGCNVTNREYSIDKQYDLAESRIDTMKPKLKFSFTLDKETIHLSETILFTAHFMNKTNAPMMLRIPQQSGVLDINHPNTTLQYSITPLDKTTSLILPLSIFVTPDILVNTVQADEFEILEPLATKDVKLELPNIVYLKQGEQRTESVLPVGQYLINITYENLNIGYEIMKEDETRVVDVSAWVGQLDGEPALLTVLP